MTSITKVGTPTEAVGVVLCVPTSDESWSKQIQWDTDSNFGSPSDRRVPGGDSPVTILLPDDDTRRYFRWRTVRGDCSTAGAWSRTVSAKPTQIPADLPACPDVGASKPPVEFTASEDRSSGAGTATLTGDVVGDGAYTIEIIRVEKDDTETTVQTTAGVTDGGGNDPVTYSESLQEKTNLLLYAQVTDDGSGDVVQVTDTFAFDPDAIPDFQSIDISVRDDGTVEWDVLGDTDTNSGELAFDFDGDSTTDETATFSGISGSGTTTGTVASGDSGSVTVTLYSDAGQTGNSRSKTVPISRTSTDPELAQNLVADLERTNSTSTSATYSLDATTSPNTAGPVEVQLESMPLDGSGTGWSVEKAWTQIPTSDTVTKGDRYIKMLVLKVRDTGANNAVGGPAFTTLEWQFGNFGLPDEGALGSGGEIDLGGPAWLNKHAGNLDRSGTNTTRVSTVVNGLADDGRLKADQSVSFTAVSASLGTRVTRNPGMLVGKDAGSSATIEVQEHDIKPGNGTVVTYGAGSITGLSFFTLYYVYLDTDHTASIASPTYQVTQNAETALSADDRYFIGTIITPEDGGADKTESGDRTLQ